MAFLSDAPLREIPFSIHGRGIDVSLPASDAPRDLTVNFLHRPSFVARDKNDHRLALTADHLGRMRVTAPAGASKVSVRYEPPFALGIVLGSILIVVAALAATGLLRREPS